MLNTEEITLSQIRQCAQILQISDLEMLSLLQGQTAPKPAPAQTARAPNGRSLPPRKPEARPGVQLRRRGGDWNIRVEEGRKQLDQLIIQVLRDLGEPAKSTEIRREVEKRSDKRLKPNQFRQRVNALIEEGRVAFDGERAGTVYSLA